MTDSLAGVFSVVATPFAEDGAVDGASLERLVDFLIERGVDGLTVLGVMGEAARLEDEERDRVVSTALARAKGRVPVVVGASGGPAPAEIEFSRRAEGQGAAALLVLPPFASSPDLDAVAAYYRDVAAAVGIPVMVQDYPPSAGFAMPVPFLARLAAGVPGVRAVKIEDPPTPFKIGRFRAAAGARVRVFGGLGGLYCLQELERGADGIMTGYSYPEHLAGIYRRYRTGDLAGAASEYARRLPLIAYEAQPAIGLAIRKEILRRRGAIACAAVRPPAPVLDEGTRAELGRAVERAGV